MSKAPILRPALSGDKTALSKQARKEVQALFGNAPRQFLMQVFGAWFVIIGIVTFSVYVDNLWMTILAVFIVATRFNILGLLTHEQAHWLGLRGRFGDMISNILVAYPLGITVEDYARVHLSHHRHYFTEGDPDFFRKSGKNWTFPMSYLNLTKLLLSDLFGISFFSILMSKRFKDKSVYNRLHASPKWFRPVYYVVMLALMAYFNLWQVFFVYWLLPLATVMPLIVRFFAVCEHVYGIRNATIIESSPLIILRWWEKLLLPNLNFTMHPYHHFYQGIPFCHLPKVHAIFQRDGLVNEQNVFYGYWSYLKFLQMSCGPVTVTSNVEKVETV